MDKLVIAGGAALRGQVRISGAKNASLAILCASAMASDRVLLENVPRINDVHVMTEILRGLGAKVSWQGVDSLQIIPAGHLADMPPYELAKKLRASNLLLGPLVARFGQAEVSLPGGCNIGVRPMDLHFKGLIGLGAELSLERGAVKACARGLRGTRVYLDFPSVGATENIMMAACLAEGQTVIENVAKEPEVVDLANFLNCLGAKVRGAGTDVIKVEGVSTLGGCLRYAVIPDRIEAGTFMVAAAATRGRVTLENIIPQHLEPLIAKLREAGVDIQEEEDGVQICAEGALKPIDIKTMPYPGFPTDMQSQLMALLSTVPGTSLIVENIFENRFRVADELKRMGARIKVEGRVAVIEGVEKLHGTQVRATDLRAGAALVVAGLMAEGETEICNTSYIDRGYHHLEHKLRGLGANIWRAGDPETAAAAGGH
ncbi:UDP-N-acetylglucosamine 1-carboxyvinyltransferase [Desulfotomaculum copahuensis]|uniref:UDP-N-acetylglucosamine 1-carboxyvinyltransferase n=1 Tax=Desulfotomaculum copahuensis TaxID=1838280 RepID=A0A1B7LD26_9FIRM|nr:UDP-N-acetylglucosamine 1-carboxyvinyltransferase [Desulfotomaculum copahuensis]OAT80841.1 UDP-N-acetylglucosamine 1-carboxyvinyltransferase [Desulfotomaculum copahuensis]